jgi:hypothetical protein
VKSRHHLRCRERVFGTDIEDSVRHARNDSADDLDQILDVCQLQEIEPPAVPQSGG